jgi:hypothetical protein
MPDQPDPFTVELPLADVFTVLRMLEQYGMPFGLQPDEAAAVVRIDEAAVRQLFPIGSQLPGFIPALIGHRWRARAGQAEPIAVKPVPGS